MLVCLCAVVHNVNTVKCKMKIYHASKKISTLQILFYNSMKIFFLVYSILEKLDT